jgi:ABC-type sugar transport system substrate-binding protein
MISINRLSSARRGFLAAAAAATVLFAGTVSPAFADTPKKVTIGVTVPTLAAQFWNRYVDFLQQGAKAYGIDVVVLDADNNPDKMGRNVEDLIAKGVDGIIHVAYWNTGVKVLTEAKAANIPVVFADVYLPDISPQDKRFSNYIAFVGPSDEAAGYEMATTLFKALQPNEKGEKVVGVVDGTPGTSVAIDRRKGFDRALKENKDVRLAGSVNGNFVRDTSQTAFESLYQGNPDIKGVWAANGGTATGVMAALKNAGKTPGKDVLVVAMDLNPENVDAIESGELLFDIGGHWLQGGFALTILNDYLNKHPIDAKDANVKLKLLPLTKELITQFRKDYPKGIPDYDWKQHSKIFNPDAVPTLELTYSNVPK